MVVQVLRELVSSIVRLHLKPEHAITEDEHSEPTNSRRIMKTTLDDLLDQWHALAPDECHRRDPDHESTGVRYSFPGSNLVCLVRGCDAEQSEGTIMHDPAIVIAAVMHSFTRRGWTGRVSMGHSEHLMRPESSVCAGIVDPDTKKRSLESDLFTLSDPDQGLQRVACVFLKAYLGLL